MKVLDRPAGKAMAKVFPSKAIQLSFPLFDSLPSIDTRAWAPSLPRSLSLQSLCTPNRSVNALVKTITMKFFKSVILAVALAAAVQGANLQSANSLQTIVSLMGKNSLYAEVVKGLKHDAPAKVIAHKMDELQAVLSTRMNHVKEGCAIDTEHFAKRLATVSGNVTRVNATLATAKRCIAEEFATEQDLAEAINANLKDIVPERKFNAAKLRLKQVRFRAAKLMKAHDARHERYQKEQIMFKEQDKILDHVIMSTIEKFYKKKKVNSEAVKVRANRRDRIARDRGAQEQGAQGCRLQAVGDRLSQQEASRQRGRPQASKVVVTKADAPKKGKFLAGTIYEAITELKGTFENEQKIRTLRYESRKDEHTQEIQALSKEEEDIKTEVTGYIANNKNITQAVNALKAKVTKATDKQAECKKESTEIRAQLTALKVRLAKRKHALNHTKTLCDAQMRDIMKEMKLCNYIAGLIQKRVKKIQKALQQFEKESGESMTGSTGSTGATGATGGASLEAAIKNSEDCAKHGVSFWCSSEENMKQCGVTAADCKRMKTQDQATDPDLTATGPSGGNSMTGAANSNRKNRKRSGTGSTGSTGSTGGATGGATGTNSAKLLPAESAAAKAVASPSAAASPSVAASSTEAAKQKLGDFNKLLKIFDQNKDRRIGWDEILAVTGHNDPKMKREFQEAAGEDMKMDYKEFHKFMNKETGKKFFF